MTQDRSPQDQDKYVLRFPDGMRDRLKAIAAENSRSLNAEIVYRLQTTLEMDSYVPSENIQTDDTALELAKALVKRLEAERG